MKKALLFLGILVFSALNVYAEENVLQTIEIVPVKDTYNIVLVADKVVDVKKSVQAQNKINLELKGIRASRTLNTVYNNVSNVDTVMVEPQGNGINIFFQAENAQAASVSFDSMKPAAAVKTKQASQSVKLSNPIESYAPIYSEDYSQEKTSNLFNKLTNKSNSIKSNVKEGLNESNTSETANKLISYGLIGLLAFSVIRLFKRKEPNMKIGLSQSLNEREIEMYGGRQPLAINTYEKPFTTTVNYGLNAYQKGNRNPYETEPMTIHNPRLRNYAVGAGVNNAASAGIASSAALGGNFDSALTQATQTVAKPAAKTISKPHTTPVNTAPVNQSNPNIDNLKFLESMTAIYEKSGRHDLAQGLKASLTKNNIKA